MLKGLMILCGFYLLGDFLSALFDWPIPGSVMGMLLLFICLMLRGGVSENLRSSSQVLLPYLPLFIVPASVGILNYWPLIQQEGLAILFAIFISVLIGLPVCGWLMQQFMREKS